MSRKKSFLSLAILVLIVFAALSVLVIERGPARADTVAVQVTVPDPIAVIKSQLVGGQERSPAALSEVRVKRAGGGEEPGSLDMRLFAGDEITTGPNAQLTILFLDDAPEKSNEVLVDSNSRVRVGSIFTWLGRVLIRCRGAFDARSEKVRLGVQGTEFELVVQPDGANRVTVLEGSVSVENLTTARIDDRSKDLALDSIFPSFLKTTFARQQPRTLELVAVEGQPARLQNTFTFTNRCQQRHRYEINPPRNLEWFRFLSAESFVLNGREQRSLIFTFELDTRRVAQGRYEGEIIARCLDCAQEPGCDVGGLLLPVQVNVLPKGSGGIATPDPDGPTTDPQLPKRVLAGPRQSVVLDAGGMRAPTTASDAELRESVNWSNNVIIIGQPQYSAQLVVPHFSNWSVRDQQFREARMQAILRNDPRAYEVLGDVYTDWGNGAKAVDAYSRSRSAAGTASAEFFEDIAEAHRLAGELDKAEGTLKRALDLSPQSAVALNTLGNIYRDRAAIASDRREFQAAERHLDQARIFYEQALAAAPRSHHVQRPARGRSAQAIRAVAQSNLGEIFWERGEIAREQGRNEEALRQFSTAEIAFRRALDLDREYVFARKGLGDVYLSSGQAARAQGIQSTANQFFASSQQAYREALSVHRDMAEAFVGLGDLFFTTSRREEAIRHYMQAAQLRPEQPEPHFRLAVALAGVNPRLAAEYAATFVKLERRPFRGGGKTQTAERVKRGEKIPDESVDRDSGGPGGESTFVKVPGLKGDKPESALRELRKLGFQAQLRDEPDCAGSGKVTRSDPEKDARIAKGSMVTVFISSFGPNAIVVPRLTGASIQNAEAQLRRIGLSLKLGRKEETDSVAPDTVVWQQPKANSRYKRDCEVEVRVAVPIPPVQVPRLVGLDVSYAQGAIFQSHLALGNVVEVDSDSPEGTVLDQYPKEGEMAPRGSRVNLTISRINWVIVPQVVGHSLGGADEILSGVGLKHQVVGGNTENDVIKQDPSPGKRVRRGSTVRLWFPQN
jgi:beta-lactam-binding protein with PASTA domain/tetratricopeptide (TPR) repeat protein